MTYTLRRAITSEAKPLVGLYAESGGGKTHTALMLACGYCAGDMSKVAMIETEAGRGEAWADDEVVGGYSVIPIRGDFAPKQYGEAISAVEKTDTRALIIDSASHEWEGINGVLSQAADNQANGSKGPLVWQKPKISHAREFMLRLQQTPIPLVVVCMRAKYVMEQITHEDVRAWIQAGKEGQAPKPGDWRKARDLSPKQSEDILFDMFVHGWLDKERHAFHGTKYTREAMRQIFIDGEPITVDTGKRLAEWASGKTKQPAAAQVEDKHEHRGSDEPASAADPTNRDDFDPLLIKAQEWAETGTDGYKRYWKGISQADRDHIGTARHDAFKAIAAKVTQ